MHRVGSAGNTCSSSRPRKEKRFTYVLNDADDKKHCAGINCLSVIKSPTHDCDYLFTGSRDGTLKRWSVVDNEAQFSATFESHVDWVNDAVPTGNSIVSCSSDTTLKVWNFLSGGACTRTLRQHSDYVTCLASSEKNPNFVASGGLGGEVFVWDIEAALLPLSRSPDEMDDENANGIVSTAHTVSSQHSVNSNSNNSSQTTQLHGYSPVLARGHKESVYALAMNETGTLLVSGGTEKVIRVWDPRTGSKNMKLRGHTDNIRALLVDSTGRFCLSGSSDSMIRLWDLGQQRCVHSYAVHTDSVWTLASTPTFSHVYSAGKDLSLYLTDLTTREALLLCTEKQPILQLALQGDCVWVATTDSSVHRWPADRNNPQKFFENGSSFLAGNMFTRARSYIEESTPVPLYKQPSLNIPGIPGIVQHEILSNKRHVLTKDTAGSVKLWEIIRGVVLEDFGKVSFDQKREELFEMVSVPTWFTADTRLGCLSIHLDTPQCFSAEMYSADLNISSTLEDSKINLAQETLRSLMAHWLIKKRLKPRSHISPNSEARNHIHSRFEVDNSSENQNMAVLAPFQFSTISPPSIITEGSQGGPWRKKINELDGTEDDRDIPWWVLDCLLNERMLPKENAKCGFYLHSCDSSVQIHTQGKLSAPRILRIHKVSTYVLDKILDKPLDVQGESGQNGGHLRLPSLDSSLSSGVKLWKKKPIVEILCNNQVLPLDMSLATVKAYIWKKPEDLILNYRVVQA